MEKYPSPSDSQTARTARWLKVLETIATGGYNFLGPRLLGRPPVFGPPPGQSRTERVLDHVATGGYSLLARSEKTARQNDTPEAESASE